MAQFPFDYTPTNLGIGTGHNMATHNGDQNRQQPLTTTMETNNVSTIITISNTGINNPVPYYQFQQKKQGEFRFWLLSNNFQKIKFTTTEFNQLPLQQQTEIVCNQQFTSASAAITFMHECIKQGMIWKPHCEALAKSNQFTSTFIAYCKNWLKIMYYMLWYIRDVQLDNQLLCELEAAALNKLNQLHNNHTLTNNSQQLNWDDTSLIIEQFPTITNDQGQELDITIKSSGKLYKMENSNEKEQESKEQEQKSNINGINQREVEKKGNDVKQLRKMLNDIDNTYHKVDLEIEKIHEIDTRKKLQEKMEKQVVIVNAHMTQAENFVQQLPTAITLADAYTQAQQLAANQQQIQDEIIKHRIAQAQQFLKQHTKFQVENIQQQQATTISNAQWKDKEEFKDEKNENERLNLKFNGKEEELQEAAMTFIKNIQTEAETLIAREVFSESLFINHVIYKCITDKAYKDFTNSKSTELLPLNPTKVSEIVKYFIGKYRLVDYIEKLKRNLKIFIQQDSNG